MLKSQALKSYQIVSRFAGSQYPTEKNEALKHFQKVLDESPAPGSVSPASPLTIIVPHIDFRVNSSLYATAYKRLLAVKEWPEVFVILGVGHRCPYEIASIPIDYKTVLGGIETDLKHWNFLKDSTKFQLDRGSDSFVGEHSLEFVAIWIQALQALRKKNEESRIIPILMGGLHDEIGNGFLPSPQSEFGLFTTAFQGWLKTVDPAKVCIIASIDGCHVGPRFQDPFDATDHIQKIVSKWEKELWARCASSTFKEFFTHLIESENIFHFDGVGVLSLLLNTLPVKAKIDGNTIWYEESDHSIVTFSGGCMICDK